MKPSKRATPIRLIPVGLINNYTQRSPRCRSFIAPRSRFRYFEEMDYRTIENTLGLTNGALRGILGRALAAMRKQLRPALASMD